MTNIDDLISRQAVTKFLNDWLSCLFENCHKQSASDLKMIIKDFKNLPSAQPERENGEWEEVEVIADAYDIGGVKTWASKMKCDQCGFTTIALEGRFSQYNFCPNCGADMREEGDE